jgi:hypothetical protein
MFVAEAESGTQSYQRRASRRPGLMDVGPAAASPGTPWSVGKWLRSCRSQERDLTVDLKSEGFVTAGVAGRFEDRVAPFSKRQMKAQASSAVTAVFSPVSWWTRSLDERFGHRGNGDNVAVIQRASRCSEQRGHSPGAERF